jgi:hypothetical protein
MRAERDDGNPQHRWPLPIAEVGRLGRNRHETEFKARGTSNEAAWLQQAETHLYAGLRKAGIPEQ